MQQPAALFQLVLQRQNPDLNQVSNQPHGDNDQYCRRELEYRRKSQTGAAVAKGS